MVGSSNRSILYLGRWAESYKHDICSPLPDEKIGAEGEVDRVLASSPTVTPRAHKTTNTGKKAMVHHYYYGETQDQDGNTRHRNAIRIYRRERLLTSLGGVSATHDEYRTLRYGSSCSATSD